MRFVGDDDDVVALGVAFVGVYVLIEFLDEGRRCAICVRSIAGSGVARLLGGRGLGRDLRRRNQRRFCRFACPGPCGL